MTGASRRSFFKLGGAAALSAGLGAGAGLANARTPAERTRSGFAVAFEVLPHPETRSDYLDTAKSLRPLLDQIEGFEEIDRYASRSRPGWMLSLSFWADEAALTRWRAQERHHLAQVAGRARIFADYRIRVMQIISDDDMLSATRTPARRTAYRDPARHQARFLTFLETSDAIARDPDPAIASEILDSIYHPGKSIRLADHDDEAAALRWRDDRRRDLGGRTNPAGAVRIRVGEVERDYRLRDRAEAPQYME